MATTKWDPKDPSDIADYWFDWTEFLPNLETIVDATVTIPETIIQPVPEGANVYLSEVSQSFTDKKVKVRLAGGTTDADYLITCLITTSEGQVFEDSRALKVRERIRL